MSTKTASINNSLPPVAYTKVGRCTVKCLCFFSARRARAPKQLTVFFYRLSQNRFWESQPWFWVDFQFVIFIKNFIFLIYWKEITSLAHYSKNYRHLKICNFMHVNNNFYYIILCNHSRNSWPIFNRLDIFMNRFQFLIY